MRSFSVDQLDVLVLDDARALGAAAATDAAEVIRSAIEERGRANVMLATGNSQLPFLHALAEIEAIEWGKVTGFHMDEYVGLSPDHPASFRRYMRRHVISPLRPGRFFEIEGDAADPEAEAVRYAKLIADNPIDLCCLGIGENGHLAFNDPPVADFDDPVDVKLVALDDACKRQQVGEGHFAGLDDVPPVAITVTIPALLRARQVLAIVPEARKAQPVRRALEGPIDTSCPASILRRTPHAALYLDRDSAAAVSQR